MATHAQIIPPDPITIEIDGGETSATITREIWNDKAAAFLDTTTIEGIVVQLLASWIVGYIDDVPQWGPYRADGHPALTEHWFTARVSKYLSTPDSGVTVIETNDGATGTGPFGTNSDLMLNDLPPQTGARIEMQASVPGGRGPFAVRIKFQFRYDEFSSPLSKFTALATGGGIVPPDRVPNFASLLDGAEVTADDTDTVPIARGHLVADGRVVTFLESAVVLGLEDGESVELDADEEYRVTLSKDADGANVVTKGPKTEAILWPDVPEGNIFVRRLVVASADGVAVTVSPASLTGDPTYAAFHARAGVGLSVLISRGESLADTDMRQRVSHEIPVAVTASSTNRLWILPTGAPVATTTDAAPVVGAFLFAYAVTDVAAVTEISDVRPFAHRALTSWHQEVAYVEVLSELESPGEVGETAEPYAWLVLYEDTEIEAIKGNLSALGSTWTSGALKIDVLALPPGAPITDAPVSLFTDAADDDQRLTFAFDATDLRAETRFHQVRRLPKDARILLRFVEVPGASAAEAAVELRVAIHGRRYR